MHGDVSKKLGPNCPRCIHTKFTSYGWSEIIKSYQKLVVFIQGAILAID